MPKFVKKELEGYLECGLLCHAFARLKCGSCDETRLVAFGCKGRGFCPSCLGLKMSATAAHLIEDVLPHVDLRPYRPLLCRRNTPGATPRPRSESSGKPSAAGGSA